VETQAGNLSAYIPTNLISITDGQIYFEPKLFYEGQKPAVNVGLSVSRVGAKTQAPVIKAAAARLKLDYAQFMELEIFSRFGAMVDAHTKARIEHGRRIRAILAQPQFAPRSLAVQAALLTAVHEGQLDALDLDQVERFKAALETRLENICPQVIARIERDASLSDDDQQRLRSALDALVSECAQKPDERT
jgi:F-type H+-transporting ATPase subunit alpha